MRKPQVPGDNEPEETEGVPEDGGPSFEDLMMLVFSGPMCFECMEGAEAEQEREMPAVEEEE